MGKTTKKTLPPPKRVTVTLTPQVVGSILEEQLARRMEGENISIAGVVLERLERAYGVAEVT